MRTRVIVGGVLVSVGILTAGVESAVGHSGASTSALGGTTSGTPGTGSASSGTGTGTGSSSSGSAGSGTSGSGSSAASGFKDGTYTGTTENTPFGNVQVRVTVSGGKIASITPLQLTRLGGRSVQIDDYAVPILKQEAMQAQSANINTVSGATYTSQGYAQSLQSALDQAK